jgi:hypothetical protein
VTRPGYFRSINEALCTRIGEVGADTRRKHKTPGVGTRDLICECGDSDCVSTAEMTLSEFEAIRAIEGRRVLGAAHFS